MGFRSIEIKVLHWQYIIDKNTLQFLTEDSSAIKVGRNEWLTGIRRSSDSYKQGITKITHRRYNF